MADTGKGVKILVARLSSLGDIIITAPVYRNIKNKWPDCKIALLVKPQFAQALAGHPCIDEIIPLRGVRQTAAAVRQAGFTHYLDLHSNLRTWLIGILSGIKNVARYKKDSLARRLFVGLRIPSPRLQRHVLDRYLEALAQWDIPVTTTDPELSDINFGEAKPKAALSKICIFQTAFLGDAVLTSPLITKLPQFFPGVKISVMSRPETADIFRSLPEVSSVLTDDKHKLSMLGGIRSAADKLRAENFDAIIIPHRSFRSALIACLSGIPTRIGFSSSAGRVFLTHTVPFSWLLHDAERNLSLLNALVPDALAAQKLSMTASEPASAAITRRLEAAGAANAVLVGVHPGSVWFTKRWPAERFAALIKKLSASGARAVLVGGKGDRQLCADVIAASGTDAINWAGETSLPELMAIMPRLKLFITNDSGPMHIATAFGVPTLALFGPTTKELGFFPYGKGHRVLQAKLSCRPCALHGGRSCPHGHFLCMRLLTVNKAADAALEMLRA